MTMDGSLIPGTIGWSTVYTYFLSDFQIVLNNIKSLFLSKRVPESVITMDVITQV